MSASSIAPPAASAAHVVEVTRRVRGRLYRGYRLINHGYYPPDRCVWWEAENLKTGEADFRATTRRELKVEIDSANVKGHATDGARDENQPINSK